MVKMCRKCAERPASPAKVKHRQYICAKCHNAQPTNRAARARYRASARGREVRRVMNVVSNRRRIYIGKRYHSQAATVEQADAINTRIKERLRESQPR